MIPFVMLGVFIVYIIVTFAVSSVVLAIPVAAVGAMVVLACVLAALLNQIPIWVHGLFFIGLIAAGAFFSHIAFMVMIAFVYLCAVALLFTWMQDYKR